MRYFTNWDYESNDQIQLIEDVAMGCVENDIPYVSKPVYEVVNGVWGQCTPLEQKAFDDLVMVFIDAIRAESAEADQYRNEVSNMAGRL